MNDGNPSKVNEQHSGIPPKWFWVVSGILLVWNLLGVMAFAQQMMITPEQVLAMPQPEQDLFNSMPMWANIIFACAVIDGAVGCLLLLMRSWLAQPVLIFSLVAVLIQMGHSLFVMNSIAVYGPGGAVMPVMVIVIALYLVALANKAKANGWLR